METCDTRLLIVDDETSNLESLRRIFEREGYQVFTAPNAKQALTLCRETPVNVVLTDLMMPGMSGIELVKGLHTVLPGAQVVLMTAFGTVEKAVEAIRAGAYDFVEKPLKRLQIVKTVAQAAERCALIAENTDLKRELSQLRDRSIIGSSTALRRALDIARQAAPSTASVLVLGESGTGKELIARYIHERSQRKNFVGVNVAALAESLVESELFGHEKGSFTGAVAQHIGRIAEADGGTLFLDEIGELSASIQVKLLRVLQEGEFEPVGGRTRKADFRLIAATNKNLSEAVEAGEFREDLYYRLNVIALTSPPLRDRLEDVPLLANHFIEVYCNKNKRPILQLTTEAIERLMAYRWPGNVRELENVIERAVVLCTDDVISIDNLPDAIRQAQAITDTLSFKIGTPLEEVEHTVIHQTLRHTKGDKQLAAQLLGISARTIYRKLDAGQIQESEAV